MKGMLYSMEMPFITLQKCEMHPLFSKHLIFLSCGKVQQPLLYKERIVFLFLLKCIPIYAFILIVVGDKKARVKLAAMGIKVFKVCACNIQMPCVRNLRKINIAAEQSIFVVFIAIKSSFLYISKEYKKQLPLNRHATFTCFNSI